MLLDDVFQRSAGIYVSEKQTLVCYWNVKVRQKLKPTNSALQPNYRYGTVDCTVSSLFGFYVLLESSFVLFLCATNVLSIHTVNLLISGIFIQEKCKNQCVSVSAAALMSIRCSSSCSYHSPAKSSLTLHS